MNMRHAPLQRNSLPWAAPCRLGRRGHVLTSVEAQQVFGGAFDSDPVYIVAERGFARRVIASISFAVSNGLNFIFSGEPCCHGHYSPRRLRTNGPPECYACRAEHRAEQKKWDKAAACDKEQVASDIAGANGGCWRKMART